MLVIKNVFKMACVLYVSMFLLTACGDIPMRQWLSHRAQVIDVDTGKPLEGVIVLAKWRGRKNLIVETQGTCYHVATATTDKKGWFEIPSFNEGFGKASISGKFRVFNFYRKGYVFYSKTRFNTFHEKQFYMKKFKGTKEDRFKFLSGFNASCHSSGDSEKDSYNIRKSIYEEAKLLVFSKEQKRLLEYLLWSAEDSLYGVIEAEKRHYKRIGVKR